VGGHSSYPSTRACCCSTSERAHGEVLLPRLYPTLYSLRCTHLPESRPGGHSIRRDLWWLVSTRHHQLSSSAHLQQLLYEYLVRLFSLLASEEGIEFRKFPRLSLVSHSDGEEAENFFPWADFPARCHDYAFNDHRIPIQASSGQSRQQAGELGKDVSECVAPEGA
jgi:hypothetical protein